MDLSNIEALKSVLDGIDKQVDDGLRIAMGLSDRGERHRLLQLAAELAGTVATYGAYLDNVQVDSSEPVAQEQDGVAAALTPDTVEPTGAEPAQVLPNEGTYSPALMASWFGRRTHPGGEVATNGHAHETELVSNGTACSNGNGTAERSDDEHTAAAPVVANLIMPSGDIVVTNGHANGFEETLDTEGPGNNTDTAAVTKVLDSRAQETEKGIAAELTVDSDKIYKLAGNPDWTDKNKEVFARIIRVNTPTLLTEIIPLDLPNRSAVMQRFQKVMQTIKASDLRTYLRDSGVTSSKRYWFEFPDEFFIDPEKDNNASDAVSNARVAVAEALQADEVADRLSDDSDVSETVTDEEIADLLDSEASHADTEPDRSTEFTNEPLGDDAADSIEDAGAGIEVATENIDRTEVVAEDGENKRTTERLELIDPEAPGFTEAWGLTFQFNFSEDMPIAVLIDGRINFGFKEFEARLLHAIATRPANTRYTLKDIRELFVGTEFEDVSMDKIKDSLYMINNRLKHFKQEYVVYHRDATTSDEETYFMLRDHAVTNRRRESDFLATGRKKRPNRR